MKKFLLASLIFIYSISFAQWTTDYNTNTSVATSIAKDIQTIGTNDGKTYVIYWDETTGPYQYKLKIQLLDQNGNRLFGENGMSVNDNIPMGTYTMIRDEAVDAEGNVYFAVISTAGDYNGYLFKISPTGEKLFGEEGIIIKAMETGPRVVPTSDGGVILGWNNKIMKYNATGEAVWAQPQLVSSKAIVGELALLSDNSLIVLYHNTSVGIFSNLWAQRFDINGQPVWAQPVQLSDKTTNNNRRYEIAKDGDVIYLGYFAYDNDRGRFDSYLQRINPDSTLPWGINGVDYSQDDSLYDMYTYITTNQDSDYVWSAVMTTNFSQNLYGTSIQKFNKETGERKLGNIAKEIFPLTDRFQQPFGIELVNNKPLLLFSDEAKFGVTYLNEYGNFIWDNHVIYIATTETLKNNIKFTKNINKQSVAAWSEDRGDGSKMYAQNFVVDDNMGVSDTNHSNLKFYPNPVQDILTISSKKNIKETAVFNLVGQKVLNSVNVKNGRIDVSTLTSGVYVLQVKTEDGKVETAKIIKK